MLIVVYDAFDGTPIRDGDVHDIIDVTVKNLASIRALTEVRAVYASSVMIDAYRLAISEGRIPVEDIAFEFKGNRLRHDHLGQIEHWPDGFCDTGHKIIGKIIGWDT